MEGKAMHLNDGQLRAHLDGELRDADQHLAACPDCRARLAVIKAQSQRVNDRLAALDLRPGDPHLAARPALARFKMEQSPQRKESSVFNPLFGKRFRLGWGLAGVAALVAVSMLFPPVRAWAGRFLGLFRVQQITVVPIDTTRLSQLNNDEMLGQQIGQLFADSFTVLKQPGEPQAVSTAAEARQLAGFNVRAAEGASQFVVQAGAAFEFVVDRDRAQAILDDAGRSDLQLPASLDGAKITVDIPTGVATAYGPCPNIGPVGEDELSDAARGYGVHYKDCVVLAQIPSPTVNTPPDLDVAQLAEMGLQFLGMSADEARAFSQTVDWTSTLVIPIPRNAQSYTQVPVDGVTGNLLERIYNDDGIPAHYTLLWVKDGVVYALTGYDNPQAGLRLANSLK
jgi:hypothetical protein